jgi:hypothetical protein
MDINLKVHQIVRCPADRGDAPYTARIIGIDQTVKTNINGILYVWVTVMSDAGRSAVWPSHRLGGVVTE